jgi:hypothetical protein
MEPMDADDWLKSVEKKCKWFNATTMRRCC